MKKSVGILLAVFLVLILMFWLVTQRKAPTDDVKLNPSSSSKETKRVEIESNEGKALVTYQPKVYKNPFKPLVEPVQNNNLPEEFPPLPENSDLLPPPEPIRLPTGEQTPEISKEEQKIALKGILEDTGGFSALITLGDKSLLVKPGESLEGVGRILSINRDKVVLQKGAEKIILEIGKD